MNVVDGVRKVTVSSLNGYCEKFALQKLFIIKEKQYLKQKFGFLPNFKSKRNIN